MNARTNFKKKVAVFDIDGTIFRSSLLIEFNKGLQKSGVITSGEATDILKPYYAWVERRGSYDEYIDKVVEVHVRAIKGKQQKYTRAAADLVFLNYRDRVYRYTRNLLIKLQKTHLLLAISGSPSEIVDPFCRYFGFDYTWGVIYEVNDSGVYTGKIIDRRSVNKKDEILWEFVDKHGLTLKDSWGIGDTSTDMSILEIVVNPIAFNPSMKLYKVAKLKHWPVVVERKNVIYEIST